jgi:hypothetical protein
MSEPSSGLLSVRGEARVTVAPDFGVFNGALKAVGETKAEAVQSAAAGLRQLTDTLSSLGGVPLGVDSRRRPLTWSAYSATTELEHADDQSTGKWQLTGRTVATTTVQLVVRDFDVIDRLGGALAAHDGFSVHYVHWTPTRTTQPGPRSALRPFGGARQGPGLRGCGGRLAASHRAHRRHRPTRRRRTDARHPPFRRSKVGWTS